MPQSFPNMPTRALSRTGERVSILGLGGSHTAKPEVTTLLAKTAQAAQHGKYELFKPSSHFDSTAQHPKWLGEDSRRVRMLAGD